MRPFARRRNSAPPPTEVIPARPRSLDDEVDDLAVELVDRAFARRARALTIDALSATRPDEWPTDAALANHLAIVIGDDS